MSEVEERGDTESWFDASRRIITFQYKENNVISMTDVVDSLGNDILKTIRIKSPEVKIGRKCPIFYDGFTNKCLHGCNSATFTRAN